jgi:anti-anti-sigma factor
MLVVNIQNAGDAVILKCTGRVVAGEEVAALKRTALCHQESKTLILDLAKVETLDCAGLGLLAFLAGWSRVVGTRLMILNPSYRVLRLLELTNLDSVLEIAPSESMPAFGGAAAESRRTHSLLPVRRPALHCHA